MEKKFSTNLMMNIILESVRLMREDIQEGEEIGIDPAIVVITCPVGDVSRSSAYEHTIETQDMQELKRIARIYLETWAKTDNVWLLMFMVGMLAELEVTIDGDVEYVKGFLLRGTTFDGRKGQAFLPLKEENGLLTVRGPIEIGEIGPESYDDGLLDELRLAYEGAEK